VSCNSSVHSLCPVVNEMENNILCIPEFRQPRPSYRLLESAQKSFSRELPYGCFHLPASLERNFKRKPFLHDDKMNDKVHWWEQTLKSLLVILVHWDKHLNSSRIYMGKQSCILLPYCFWVLQYQYQSNKHKVNISLENIYWKNYPINIISIHRSHCEFSFYIFFHLRLGNIK